MWTTKAQQGGLLRQSLEAFHEAEQNIIPMSRHCDIPHILQSNRFSVLASSLVEMSFEYAIVAYK